MNLDPDTANETPESQMDEIDAILLIEGGGGDYDEDEMIAAWQRLYDTGIWKRLQGSYQRGMLGLIQNGLIQTKDPHP